MIEATRVSAARAIGMPLPSGGVEHHGQVVTFPELTPAQQKIRETINRKMEQTRTWVENNIPGMNAVFLMHGAAWQQYPDELQKLAGEWIAEIIADVYPQYPLPNASAEFNAKQIAEGGIHPYFILLVPNDINQEAVNHDPRVLLSHKDKINAVAVTARIIGDSDNPENAVDELGRTARKTGFPDIKGGALVSQSDLDWELFGKSRAVIADVRAAAEHGTTRRVTPSGGATQHIFYGELGMFGYMYSQAYSVGGDTKKPTLEPFVKGMKVRDYERHEQLRLTHTVYVAAGESAEFVQELSRHQYNGKPATIKAVERDKASAQPYKWANAASHGAFIYGGAEVIPSRIDAPERIPFMEAIAQLEIASPEVIVQIPANTMESAATQYALLDKGYIVCGLRPAYEETIDGEKVISPAMIYMAKAGDAVARGDMHIAKAYFPDGLYSPKLQAHFVRIDEALRRVA